MLRTISPGVVHIRALTLEKLLVLSYSAALGEVFTLRHMVGAVPVGSGLLVVAH